MPNKLLVVGHLAKDVVKTKSGAAEYWGGAGYHVALAAAMCLPKDSVVLRSVAGNDFDKLVMSRFGVETKYLTINMDIESDRHFLDESGELRTYYKQGCLSDSIDLLGLDELMKDISWVHMASSSPEQQLIWLRQIEQYKRDNLVISGDTFDTFTRDVPEMVRQVFSRCNIGFLNEIEWKEIAGEKLSMTLIKKLGSNGAEIYSNFQRICKVVSPVAEKVVDTIGAGEVVAGVFIAKKLLGATDSEALTLACKLASKSVENYGTDSLRLL